MHELLILFIILNKLQTHPDYNQTNQTDICVILTNNKTDKVQGIAVGGLFERWLRAKCSRLLPVDG